MLHQVSLAGELPFSLRSAGRGRKKVVFSLCFSLVRGVLKAGSPTMSKLFRRHRRPGRCLPPPVTSRPGQRRLRLEVLEERQMLAVYAVDDVGDSTSSGTLRWAIEQANDNPGDDEIQIDADIITPINITNGQLPAITGGVTIEYLGAGRVEVNYSAYPSSQNVSGLVIDIGAAADVEIRGLHVRNFTGSGILVADDLDDLTIENCTIDSNGHWPAAGDHGDGIRIADQHNPIPSRSASV